MFLQNLTVAKLAKTFHVYLRVLSLYRKQVVRNVGNILQHRFAATRSG